MGKVIALGIAARADRQPGRRARHRIHAANGDGRDATASIDRRALRRAAGRHGGPHEDDHYQPVGHRAARRAAGAAGAPATSSSCELTSLTTRHASLEDVFVKLAGRHLGRRGGRRCMKTTPELPSRATGRCADRARAAASSIASRRPVLGLWFSDPVVVGWASPFAISRSSKITVDVRGRRRRPKAVARRAARAVDGKFVRRRIVTTRKQPAAACAPARPSWS